MIYIVVKYMKVKNECKDQFNDNMLGWIASCKKEPLNLSIDGCWKEINNFMLVERWSDEEAYSKYLKKPETKALYNSISALLIDKPTVLKYPTIS